MKKFLLLMILALLLAVSTALADGLNLPTDLAAALAKEGYLSDHLTGYIEQFGSMPFFSAVTVRSDNGLNELFLFKLEASGRKLFLRTSAALPQDAPQMLFDRSNTVYNGRSYGTAFSVCDNTASGRELIWVWSAGQGAFQLDSYLTHDSTFDIVLETVVASDAGLSYVGWRTEERQVFYHGTVQRNLKYFTWDVFPTTPEEMRRKLTVAPEIPLGEMQAVEVHFTGGERYAVYTGPGTSYLRANEGKATVSTNDWIQVFGSENGYILIQYAIERGHMRFGWIPAEALPRDTYASTLSFAYDTAFVATAETLTDDPLYSKSVLLPLPAGAQVRLLSTMGDWVYLEYTQSTQPARGFVPKTSLTRLSESAAIREATAYLLAANQVAEGNPLTNAILSGYAISAVYADGFWKVSFDSGRDYAFVVTVSDQSGLALELSSSNG